MWHLGYWDMARGIAELGELTSLDQRIELEWQDVRNVGMVLRILARVSANKNIRCDHSVVTKNSFDYSGS